MAKTRPEPQPTAEAPRGGIKVRAIADGYYGHIRRREGDVFVIENEQAFSSKWMERAGAREPERVTTTQQALRKAHHALVADKTPGQGEQFAHESDDNPLNV